MYIHIAISENPVRVFILDRLTNKLEKSYIGQRFWLVHGLFLWSFGHIYFQSFICNAIFFNSISGSIVKNMVPMIIDIRQRNLSNRIVFFIQDVFRRETL